MAALGRVLQVVGWIWVAVGFFGPVVGLPDGINFLPGVILVFVSRLLRVQAERNAPRETEAEPEPAPQRILNTERRPQRPAPRPPETQPARPPPPSPDPMPVPTPEPLEEPREDVLEKIFLAGNDVVDEVAELPADDDVGSRPMSSAEMIARAKRRWDRS
ncbi:MAG: hypothetical protein WAL25_13860 [Acidimicrobiia bacterium]